MITLTLTTTSARAIDRLKAQAPIAQARALNRAIASAKTIMLREISRDISVKVGDLRDKIGVEEARPDRLRARLSASYARIPLMDFGAKGPNPSRGRGRVTANLGGRKSYPGLFIATMPGSGHTGVFGRSATTFMQEVGPRGGRRQAIVERFGPSIAHVFLKHADVGLARGLEQLVKNLKSEFRFALSQTT